MRLSDIISESIKQEYKVHRDGFFSRLLPIDQLKETNNTLVFIENDNLFSRLSKKTYSSIILNFTSPFINSVDSNVGIILTSNPRKLFYQIHNVLSESLTKNMMFPTKISSSAQISRTCIISDRGVLVGNNVVIGEHSVIHGPVTIEDDVVIGSNTVIGSDGFVFYRDSEEMFQIKSLGGVVIETKAIIKSNVCIDKGVFGGNTIVAKGSAIDNLVNLGHDCYIGENSIIVAGSSIGGWTKVGRNSWIGINCSISNNVILGDFSRVLMGSVIANNIPSKSTYSGYFAEEHNKNILSQIKLKRLK